MGCAVTPAGVCGHRREEGPGGRAGDGRALSRTLRPARPFRNSYISALYIFSPSLSIALFLLYLQGRLKEPVFERNASGA